MSSDNKFENMSYEEALSHLQKLISVLEKNTMSFEDTMKAYKEAFEYFAFCSEYLSRAEEKVKALNNEIADISPFAEV